VADLTHVDYERLVDGVARQGGNNLSICSENQVSRPRFTGTYDSLNASTILLAVMLKVVEDLGTRYCADGR